MQKDAWSKFSLDSLVTNRDKKFCDADTLTEEMKELLIEKILEAIDKVYAILEAVEPCGEDNRRELWLKAERGTIDDYDDYESLKDEEVVENYEEFEKMWHEEYPDEISWYHLVTIERDDYRAIFLGRELIYQSRILEAHSSYEYNVEELFVWMQDAVKRCIAQMKEGTYNEDVNDNLNARQRTGTISRKDYWDIFPERKDSYLSDITAATTSEKRSRILLLLSELEKATVRLQTNCF